MTGVEVTEQGLQRIQAYLSRMQSGRAETLMVERIEQIVEGDLSLTEFDIRFYTHELRELERIEEQGVSLEQTGEEIPYELYNAVHTASLEDYGVDPRRDPLYHPEVHRDVADG